MEITKVERLRAFILPKIKFGLSSVVSTAIDYSIFFLIFPTGLPVWLCQAIAHASGMISNFILQKTFIFRLKRSLFRSFQFSMLFSILGLAASSGVAALLIKIDFFATHPILMKLCITIALFLYNFYTKRFSFEGK